MKKIHSKLKVLEWSQYFSHYQSMEIFQTLKGSLLHSPSSNLAKFRSIRELMGVHVACKNEEDPIKSVDTGVVTIFVPFLVFGDFSRCPRAANS